MNRLRTVWAKSIRLATRKPYLSIAICALLVIGLGSVYTWQQTARQHRQERAAVAALEAQRRALLHKDREAAKPPTDIVTDTAFKDISDTAFKAPDCARLKNRKAVILTSATCNYRLQAFGKINMAVVFVETYGGARAEKDLLSADNPNSVRSLAQTNAYLARQAARYKIADPPKIAFTYFGPYKTDSAVNTLYYRDNGAIILSHFEKTATYNKVPVDTFDAVHYILLENQYGGMAFPSKHRAFTYTSSAVGVFTHESLHLFGASDKYNNNDCNTIGGGDPFGRYNGTQPGKDIMCTSSDLNSNINDITAREIGWLN